MSIVNRRNATIGWLVVKVGKRAARKKAQEAVPAAKRKGGALAGALAALAGLLMLKRKKRSDTAE
jgi:hypothetical protein